MNKIKFGTDGWRAIIGEEYTTDNVARVSVAVADWLNEKYNNPSVVLGHDCRFGGELFTKPGAKVLCIKGVSVKIAKGFVKKNQNVKKGEVLVIIEAMKMENILRAELSGKVKKIHCSDGDSLASDQIILEFL